jgi:hypothetical protein
VNVTEPWMSKFFAAIHCQLGPVHLRPFRTPIPYKN